MQGRDLAPLYLHEDPAAVSPPWRTDFFYEHPTITSRDRIPASVGVIRRDWKFIRWPEYDAEQFFDLTQDPGELVNLATEPAAASRVAAARRSLAAWQDRVR